MSIRVLIVDDSSFVRDVIRDVLQGADDIEVVGEARDGQEALQKLSDLRPDVVTMDLLMPMVDGLEAAQSIMNTSPTAILLVADTNSIEELRRDAEKVGAVGAFAKPHEGFGDEQSQALAQAIRDAARTRPRRSANDSVSPPATKFSFRRVEVLGIVSSTGGPQTLAKLLSTLPKILQIPICVVQHTSPGFSGTLAKWLGDQCEMPVELAENRTALRPGVITVAPDDKHLEVRSGGIVRLSEAPAIQSLRPSGDVLLSSLASSYGKSAAGLVCTGMGHDGSEGLHAMHVAGGLCLVQDPKTAVLSSMPQSAERRVPASRVVTLERLVAKIKRELT